MEIVFHPEALDEFKAETAFYEGIQSGLGAAFADEVLRMIELARLFPRLGTPEEDGVRSLITKRFPFLIYYEIVADQIRVRAVLDCQRDPKWIRSRLRN